MGGRTTGQRQKLSLEQARRLFLETIRELAPDVLDDLARSPFARYQVFAKRIPARPEMLANGLGGIMAAAD